MKEIQDRLFIIAPNYRQARIFLFNMDWMHRHFRIALRLQDILGHELNHWEVWWLDRMWPCDTTEDVEFMLEMKRQAKFRGADLHRWWT